MPRVSAKNYLYIGVGSHIVAIDPATGEEAWRTRLKHTSFVTIKVVGNDVYGGASGELFCLDARSGELKWHNKLKGLGMGMVVFDGATAGAAAAALQQQQAAAVAAAT